VINRGLKVVLRTCAQQRAQFADELKVEIQRLGGRVSERDSILGIIHRGRIDILAALTIGAQNVENVVLDEAILGEQTAVKSYGSIVGKALAAETRALVERQYKYVQEASDLMNLLRGRSGRRLIVRLFDSDRDVEEAIQALKSAGFSSDGIETVDAKQATRIYEGRGNVIGEAVLAGAVGGALWGSLIGALAGVSAVIIPGMDAVLGGSPQRTWAVIALAGIVFGALIAAFLGLMIGADISEQDTFLYDNSLKHGLKLVRLRTDNNRAEQAARIMRQVNDMARAHAVPALRTPIG